MRTLYFHPVLSSIFFPLTEFRHVQNLFCVQVLRSPILAALLQQRGQPNCGVVQGMELWNFRRGRHFTYIRLGGHHVGHRPTF